MSMAEPEVAEPTATPSDDAAAPERSELDVVRERLRETEARLRTVSKAYTELQAEMQQFRVRVEAQGETKAMKKTAELVGALLDPVQNLRRSVSDASKVEDGQESPHGLVEGLKMVVHQFDHALHKLGLTEVPGAGALFDPRMHEALGLTPVADKSLDGRVLMVHDKGYLLGGHVLKVAQVIVGKLEEAAAPPPAQESAADAEEPKGDA
jgi:molecular chaperone GrpE